jgi:hypothetical protein
MLHRVLDFDNFSGKSYAMEGKRLKIRLRTRNSENFRPHLVHTVYYFLDSFFEK